MHTLAPQIEAADDKLRSFAGATDRLLRNQNFYLSTIIGERAGIAYMGKPGAAVAP